VDVETFRGRLAPVGCGLLLCGSSPVLFWGKLGVVGKIALLIFCFWGFLCMAKVLCCGAATGPSAWGCNGFSGNLPCGCGRRVLSWDGLVISWDYGLFFIGFALFRAVFFV